MKKIRSSSYLYDEDGHWIGIKWENYFEGMGKMNLWYIQFNRGEYKLPSGKG